MVRKYGLIYRAILISAVLTVLKYYVDQAGVSFIPVNPLITALFGGVFFTLGILFASAAADYKEAEKIPGELAVLLKSVKNDLGIIKPALQNEVNALLYAINDNFRNNKWKLARIDAVAERINTKLANLNAPPNFIVKIRSELTQIDRLAHRVDVITETTMIPTAYAIAEYSVGLILTLLMLIKLDFWNGGPILMGATSSLLLSLLIIIKDMDNPFQHGRQTHADVELDLLFKLEQHWRNQILEK